MLPRSQLQQAPEAALRKKRNGAKRKVSSYTVAVLQALIPLFPAAGMLMGPIVP